jgi:hypothetical protein
LEKRPARYAIAAFELRPYQTSRSEVIHTIM